MGKQKLWKLATPVITITVHTQCGLSGPPVLLHAVEVLNSEQERTLVFQLKQKAETATHKSAAVNLNGPFGVLALSLATRESNKEHEMISATTLTLKYKQKNVTKVSVNGTHGVIMEPVLSHVLAVR